VGVRTIDRVLNLDLATDTRIRGEIEIQDLAANSCVRGGVRLRRASPRASPRARQCVEPDAAGASFTISHDQE
jgi:hypothetical protein